MSNNNRQEGRYSQKKTTDLWKKDRQESCEDLGEGMKGAACGSTQVLLFQMWNPYTFEI